MTCRVLQTPSSGGAKTKAAPSHPHFVDYVTHSFMRRIAPATFEIIARSGIRWHTAANKPIIISVLRNYIIDNDIDGLAEHYDSMRDRSDRGEKIMVTKFLRSAQHAARQPARGASPHFFSSTAQGFLDLFVIRGKPWAVLSRYNLTPSRYNLTTSL